MKALAWYSGIVLTLGNITMLVELLQGIDIETNIWGMAVGIPVIIFFILYLKKEYKK
jgi:hypothetical protein